MDSDISKVVFHVDEKEKLQLSLNNIRNLIADFGVENVAVELVVNGVAVNEFKKEDFKYSKQVDELIALGARFGICKNSLKGIGLNEEDLIDGVEIVSSGVGELVRKQRDGWAYIRP